MSIRRLETLAAISLLLLAAQGALPAAAPEAEPKPQLQASLELHAREVVVGEPLVARVGLKNVGDSRFITTYALPGTFNSWAEIEFVVTGPDNKTLLTQKRDSADGTVYQIVPKFIFMLGDRAPAIKPAEAVVSKRTVPLVASEDKQPAWLPPGAYKVHARVSIQHLAEKFETPEETFTVKPLAAEDQGVLAIFTPILGSLLYRNGWQDFAKAQEKADEIRLKFPKAPHRQYLEYYMLWAQHTAEELQAAAGAYLNEFPDSPYVDDALWLAARSEWPKKPQHALWLLDILMQGYPNSTRKAEAEKLKGQIEEHLRLKAIVEERLKARATASAGQEVPGPPGPQDRPPPVPRTRKAGPRAVSEKVV